MYSFYYLHFVIIVVQSLSHIRLFATPWTAAHEASLSSTISSSLLKLLSMELVMPSNQLILCRPLLLLPSIFPSIRVFSFLMSQLFVSGSQRFGASASASLLPMNIQDWFPLGLTGLISLQSKGLSRVFSSSTILHFTGIIFARWLGQSQDWKGLIHSRARGLFIGSLGDNLKPGRRLWRDPCCFCVAATGQEPAEHLPLFLATVIAKIWRREGLTTPVFLPGKFHRQGILVNYSPWGCKESDTTERLTLSLFIIAKVKSSLSFGFA